MMGSGVQLTIRFDDEGLIGLGFGPMPAEDRADLAARIEEELELRVGQMLSDGMTNEDLDEFEAFHEGDAARARAWLTMHRPGYLQDEGFQRLRASRGIRNPPEESGEPDAVVAEWACVVWLEVRRPDSQEVVERAREELQRELIWYRDRLLAATGTATATATATATE